MLVLRKKAGASEEAPRPTAEAVGVVVCNCSKELLGRHCGRARMRARSNQSAVASGASASIRSGSGLRGITIPFVTVGSAQADHMTRPETLPQCGYDVTRQCAPLFSLIFSSLGGSRPFVGREQAIRSSACATLAP